MLAAFVGKKCHILAACQCCVRIHAAAHNRHARQTFVTQFGAGGELIEYAVQAAIGLQRPSRDGTLELRQTNVVAHIRCDSQAVNAAVSAGLEC